MEYEKVPRTAMVLPTVPRNVSLLPKMRTVVRMMQTRLIVLAIECVMGDTLLSATKATCDVERVSNRLSDFWAMAYYRLAAHTAPNRAAQKRTSL
jgi:hypothetical protein